MGVGTELVENFLQGATWGLSNFIGLTGREGVIHNADDDAENQAVTVDDEGVYFNESKIQIGWDDVVEIVQEGEDGSQLLRFELRGGLIFHTGWINGDIDEFMNSPSCSDVHLADLDSEDASAKNCKAIRACAEDLIWAIDLADEIRGAKHLGVNEVYLLNRIAVGYATMRLFLVDHFNTKTDSFPKNVNEAISDLDIDKFGPSAIRAQMGNLSLEVEDLEEVDKSTAYIIGLAFFWSYGDPDAETGEGIKHQREVYDALRSARSWGYDVGDSAKEILFSDEDADSPLGADAWSNYRKMIICTDKRSSLDTVDGGVKIPNVMVMDPQDIIAYNDSVGDELKLKFEVNHPQNGVSYVLHPTLKNTYISIESYHLTLLERKYEELKHILTCLGATSLELVAESSSSEDESTNVKIKQDADINVDAVGEVAASYSGSKHSARMRSLNKTLSTKRILVPRGKPYIPDDVEFYPTEQGWQRLAKLALAGKIKSEEVSLTYRNESAISGNALKSISTKLHSVIPGFSFSAEGNFESEYENELKSLESLSWNYKVGFGESCDEDTSDRSPKEEPETVETSDKKQNADGGNANRVEALILRRARQFAKADGIDLTDNHRQQLVDMGAKYGVDELRIDELIADACDET